MMIERKDFSCAKDKYLLQNLDYISDLMVGKEAHVYKYADKPSMFFDCQITLTIKEPDQQYCDVPNCPDPPRRRRQHSSLTANQTKTESPVQDNFIITSENVKHPSWMEGHLSLDSKHICLSNNGLGAMAIVNVLFVLSSGVLYWNAFRLVKKM